MYDLIDINSGAPDLTMNNKETQSFRFPVVTFSYTQTLRLVNRLWGFVKMLTC